MTQILPIILRWVENTIRQVSYHSTPISGTFPDISKPLLQMLLYAMASGVWGMNRLLSILLPRVELSDFNFQGPLEDALDKFVAGKPEKEWNHVIPESGLKWMEGYTYELKGILEKPLLDKIQSVVKEGIGSSDKEGKTEDEVRDELRKILLALTEHRLQAIARTESMRAYNMGQLVELKKSEEYVQGVEFCAILDSRTTDMCQERDGLILRANDPRVWDNTPPLHPNCRSILIPIIITEEIEDTRWDEDGLKFDNLLVEEPAMIRPKDKEHIQQIMTGDSELAAELEVDVPTIQRKSDIEAVRKVGSTRPRVEVVKSLDAPWGRLISEKEYMELSERAFDSLTVDEQDAIGKYADSWFNDINGSLRGVDRRGNAYVPRNSLVAEKTPEYISKINTAMSKAGGAPEDMRLFRGIKDTNRVFPNGLKVGDRFSDKGFVSVSSELDTSFGFSRHPDGGVLFEIEVRRGTSLLPLKNKAEQEFLLKSGQSFKVVGSRMDAITLRSGEKLPCEIIRVIAE